MSRQPSASRTDLLLACPRPFDPELPDEPDLPGEAARYGSAFHQVIAACLRPQKGALLEKQAGRYTKAVDKAAAAYDVRAAAAELAGHVKSSVGVLRAWLAREKLEVCEVETAYAIKPAAHNGAYAARSIPPHDEDHKYEIEEGDVPGTVDLIATNESRARAVVLDHKTGSYATTDFARPSRIPQMRTLGLVVPANRQKIDVEVGIFHADRLGLPIVYAEPYERAEQAAHARDLGRALSLVGSGYLRVGPHCSRCPVRALCPAHRAELISESTEVLVRSANAFSVEPIAGPLVPAGAAKLSVEERAGFLYEVLKKFEKLSEAGRAEIKRLVKEGAIIETGGKTLTIREQTYETLSMKSVREALGAVEGEKMIKKLRAKGAVRESKRQMLVGEK